MQGTTAVVFGALLVGLLFLIVAVMVFQESRSRFEERPPEYILEDAVRFVLPRLEPDARARLRRDGVRRVLEWQVFFLQQLARTDKDIPIVMGITDGTVAYIADQLRKAQHPFADDDIIAVLEIQTDYLASVGAIGEEADEEI